MKHVRILLVLWICLQAWAPRAQSQSVWVRPLVGTDGHGHTFPGAVWPFGMVQLSPDTRIDDINELGGYKFKISKPTTDYVVYLGDLNQSSLNAHIYLNYLALVYGGQIMKSKVPGSGKMYEFEGEMMELIGSVRAIQKDEWADEVNKGFQYIINILDEL